MTKVNPLKETVPSSLALVLKSCMKVKYYLQHLRMLQNPPDFTKVPPKVPPQKHSPHSALATSNLPVLMLTTDKAGLCLCLVMLILLVVPPLICIVSNTDFSNKPKHQFSKVTNEQYPISI